MSFVTIFMIVVGFFCIFGWSSQKNFDKNFQENFNETLERRVHASEVPVTSEGFKLRTSYHVVT